MRRARGLYEALRNVSLKALSLGLERLCRLVVVVAMAPVIGQVAFGQYVYASTVTALLALGTDLGLGVWTTRSVARAYGEGASNARSRQEIVEVGLAIRGLAALPYACAVAVVAFTTLDGSARVAMGLLGVAALANAFGDHFAAIVRGFERFADEARLNAVRAILLAIAGVVTVTVTRSLVGLCAGLAAANVGGVLYGAALLRRLVPSRAAGVPARVEPLRLEAPTIDWALAKAALSQSLPLWVGGIFSMLYFKVDTLFVRSLAGDAELGVYGAAFKVFEGAMILPSILLSVTFPRLARAHGDALAQRRLERHLAALLFGTGLMVGAVCFLGGTPIVRLLFGARFRDAVFSLRVLAMGIPLLFLNYGLTHFLIARDLGKITQWASITMLGLNVLLDMTLIPRGGGVGAAWATVLTELGLTVWCLAGLRLAAVPRMPRPVRAASRTGRRAE
jgi:O-antigen/teichoic acid export membrane protein